MTWPDPFKTFDRSAAAPDLAEVTNIGVLAVLLVLLLVAGFSVVTQWTVDGLRPPQVATVDD